mmetsp:Transcript_18491/g.26105  ORF Transcript_18491/g.26105 Transcript_18491/m.26105 type:complete len:146 (+) Transcript_18491:163-600(+)
MSDSSYAAATRHRRPYSKSGRPPVLELIDDEWAADKLSDDEVDAGRHEAAIAGVLEEDGELDPEAVVVSSTGNSASNSMMTNGERRRREMEGWNDLGLDQFDTTSSLLSSSMAGGGPNSSSNHPTTNGGTSAHHHHATPNTGSSN